jgi:uncharacterized protein
MRKATAVVFGLAAVLLTSTAAGAASYNCAKAAQPDEIAICKNRTLSELDVRMAALYGVRMKIPMLMGSRGAAQDEQVQFLTSRAKCGGNSACIGAAYQQRIDVLQKEINVAMQDYCVKLGICGQASQAPPQPARPFPRAITAPCGGAAQPPERLPHPWSPRCPIPPSRTPPARSSSRSRRASSQP